MVALSRNNERKVWASAPISSATMRAISMVLLATLEVPSLGAAATPNQALSDLELSAAYCLGSDREWAFVKHAECAQKGCPPHITDLVDARIRHFQSYLLAKGDLSGGDDRVLGISVAMERGRGENRAIMKVVGNCAEQLKDSAAGTERQLVSCLTSALDDQNLKANWDRIKHCAEVEKQLPY